MLLDLKVTFNYRTDRWGLTVGRRHTKVEDESEHQIQGTRASALRLL
jgi:hypothetical protein